MIKQIKCTTCEEVLGKWEKEEFTPNDLELRAFTIICSSGHDTIELVDHQEG